MEENKDERAKLILALCGKFHKLLEEEKPNIDIAVEAFGHMLAVGIAQVVDYNDEVIKDYFLKLHVGIKTTRELMKQHGIIPEEDKPDGENSQVDPL